MKREINTDLIVRTAVGAGDLLQKDWKDKSLSKVLKVKKEIDYSILMDRKSEDFILKQLKGITNATIVAEESGIKKREKTEYTIYVDPLDGTLNYSNGIPHFCVSIGVYRQNTPYFGVIYDPILKELFTAKHGRGAFLNGKPIHVRGKGSREFPIGVEASHKMRRFMQNEEYHTQHLWSMALDLCWVSCGRFAAAVFPRSNPWDIAAGIVMAEEAGAIITDFKGHKWTLVNGEKLIVSSTKELHQKLIKSL